MRARNLISAAPLDIDLGLLALRLAVGISMLFFHGWAKLTGGPEMWSRIGGSMQNLGISFLPAFWGFMAAFSESVGSSLLILGLLVRPAAALLAFTMVVAIARHLSIPSGEPASGWAGASHALELFGVYVALLLTGPGRHRLWPRPRV